MTHSRIRIALLRRMTLALFLATAVQADYQESFKEGIKALDQKKHSEAAQWFRKALAENNRSSTERVSIYGMRFVPYLPHYYLGLALYNAGDLSGAAQAWETSDRLGAVKSSKKEFKSLQGFQHVVQDEQRRRDEQRQAALQVGQAAKAEIGRAEEILDRVRKLDSDPRLGEFVDQAEVDRWAAALAIELQAARAQAEKTDSEGLPSAASEAKQKAEQVSRAAQGHLDTVQFRLADFNREQEQARQREKQRRVAGLLGQVRSGLPAWQELLTGLNTAAPDLPGVGQQLNELEDLVSSAGQAGPSSEPEVLEAMLESGDKLTGSLQSEVSTYLLERASAVARLEGTAGESRRLLDDMENEAAADSRVSGAAAQLRTVLSDSESVGTTASRSDLDGVNSRLQLQLDRSRSALAGFRQEKTRRAVQAAQAAEREAQILRQVPEPVPEPTPVPVPVPSGDSSEAEDLLRASSRALLREGDYRKVLSQLEGVLFSETENRRRAHILRAAAAFYLNEIDRSDELQRKARQEAHACLAADSGYAPSERNFTPAFVAFFELVRSEG